MVGSYTDRKGIAVYVNSCPPVPLERRVQRKQDTNSCTMYANLDLLFDTTAHQTPPMYPSSPGSDSIAQEEPTKTPS